VPIDKDEGFVKAHQTLAVLEHRLSCREVEDQISVRFTLHHLFGERRNAPRTIDMAIDKLFAETRAISCLSIWSLPLPLASIPTSPPTLPSSRPPASPKPALSVKTRIRQLITQHIHRVAR